MKYIIFTQQRITISAPSRLNFVSATDDRIEHYPVGQDRNDRLNVKLNIDTNTNNKASLEKKMRGHILAEGELVGLYEKMK